MPSRTGAQKVLEPRLICIPVRDRALVNKLLLSVCGRPVEDDLMLLVSRLSFPLVKKQVVVKAALGDGYVDALIAQRDGMLVLACLRDLLELCKVDHRPLDFDSRLEDALKLALIEAVND